MKQPIKRKIEKVMYDADKYGVTVVRWPAKRAEPFGFALAFWLLLGQAKSDIQECS